MKKTFLLPLLLLWRSSFAPFRSLGGNGGTDSTLLGGVVLMSDARLKRNVVPLSSSLKKLLQLNGYRYYWKEAAKDQSPQIGLLAQEVETVLPERVNKDDKGMPGVNYSGLIPVLINAVKEQQAIVVSLEKRITALEQYK